MNAALRLSWYKFKHHYMDFVKVLLGIVAFEGLILYNPRQGILKDFETTRMTLFLLLFSTSLLIVVQNSIYISKNVGPQPWLFSQVWVVQPSPWLVWDSRLLCRFETIVFIPSYSVFSKFFWQGISRCWSYFWFLPLGSWDYSAPGFLGVAFYCPLYLSLGWQIWDYLCYPSSRCGYHAIFIVGNYPVFAQSHWLGTKIYLSWLWPQAFLGFLVTCQTCHRAWLSTESQSLEPVGGLSRVYRRILGTMVGLGASLPRLCPYSFRHTSEEGEINATIWWMADWLPSAAWSQAKW